MTSSLQHLKARPIWSTTSPYPGTIPTHLPGDNDLVGSPHAAEATLSVLDLLGSQIRVLASGIRPAGSYELAFDASSLPSGVCFYRLAAGSFSETKRLVVLRWKRR